MLSKIEVIKKIVEERQCMKIKSTRTGKKILVDTFTASHVLSVYNALNPVNREKFEKLSIERMVDITWAVLKG